MKKYQVLVLALLAVFSLRFAHAGKERKQAEALATTPQSVRSENGSPLMDRFKKQLQAAGIGLEESALLAQPDTYRRLRIRWNAYIGAPTFVDPDERKYPVGSEFTVIGRQKGKGTLPQPRLPELSSEQLLVVGINPQGNLRAWVLIADPRILRSEKPAPSGALRGTVLHHSSPEFFVNFPDDPDITELRFYHPHWTGAEFSLELLGTVRF